MQSARALPTHAILFLEDVEGGEPPISDRNPSIRSTPSMISFPCSPAVDEGTDIIVGASGEFVLPHPPVFEGFLETPSRRVAVTTAELETCLTASVRTTRTHVRIWTNGETFPDRVWIGLD
ncbi:hypothetical protein [Terrarubrum flagellatum]|uniref:hypothetical protein n=1 Tax=Terrirubrum flagellatum TaxID=2895980 RepID=UPI003145179D